MGRGTSAAAAVQTRAQAAAPRRPGAGAVGLPAGAPAGAAQFGRAGRRRSQPKPIASPSSADHGPAGISQADGGT